MPIYLTKTKCKECKLKKPGKHIQPVKQRFGEDKLVKVRNEGVGWVTLLIYTSSYAVEKFLSIEKELAVLARKWRALKDLA